MLERLAGRGGMGEVYRALDRSTERPVAIKVLHGQQVSDVVCILAKLEFGVLHDRVSSTAALGAYDRLDALFLRMLSCDVSQFAIFPSLTIFLANWSWQCLPTFVRRGPELCSSAQRG